MQIPVQECAPNPDGQTLRVLVWEHDLIDMHRLDAAGRPVPFAGKGSTWHAHADVELTLILNGEGILAVGDAIGRFTAPDVILLGADVPHVWQADGALSGVAVQGRCEVGTGLGALGECSALSALWAHARYGLRWHGDTAASLRAQMVAVTRLPALRRVAAFLGMLATMHDGLATDAERLSSTMIDAKAMAPRHQGLARVIEHVLRNFREDLSLPALVAMSGLSQATFCRHFVRVTGKSFTAYVTALRLQEAKRALITSARPVTDIAFAAGFGNLAHFHAVFRAEVGCTPLAYRRQRR